MFLKFEFGKMKKHAKRIKDKSELMARKITVVRRKVLKD